MNSKITNTQVQPHAGELSLKQAREFLSEIGQATEGTSQTELYEFACLVSQVVDLHETAADDDVRQFVADSLEEIRAVVDDDQSNPDRMDSLRDEAIRRWGDRLVPISQNDLDDAVSYGTDPWDTDPDEQGESDVDVVTPSAEEIHSLMSQLGQTGDPSPQLKSISEPQSDSVSQTGTTVEQPSPQPSPPNSIEALDPELREAFLDDATSCVGSMEEALLRLDANANDVDALNQICRELHTLKGASASVGLSALADQLHALEDGLRDDQAAGRTPNIDLLLKEVDRVGSQIGGKDHASHPASDMPPEASGSPSPPEIANQGRSQVGPPADGHADDESVRVKSSQLNRLMDMLAELVMLRNRRETELSQLQEVYHELIGSVSKMRFLSNEGSTESPANSSLQLAEIANDVLEIAQHVRDCARPVAEGNTAVSQFIRQFRQELVELRRTPVSGLFRRLQRVVRDAAQSESKDVQLKLIGQDAGIERSLQQRLYEPLLHIVRNSVCHGIEPAEQRAAVGKNPVGTITLEAKSGPDLFIIEIRDDGRGLDYDAIRRRGVQSGLLAADQAASRHELSQLIFQPGFSTRQTANQVAGRGVGMDVVASTLGRMRGWLEVDSEPGQGTRIRLSFPLPSVIQHAMVFRSAGQLFAVPMQSVQSAGEVDKDSVYLKFSDLFGDSPDTPAEACGRIVLACRPADGPAGTSARVTLLVDEIVGPEEVVVRPLPTLLKHHPFCSGATLSGMGQTVLFLDARRVVESQSHLLHRSDSPRQSASSPDAAGSGQPARPRVLVVDDSVSARKRVVRSLQRYGVDIIEAVDGKQALSILKSEQLAAVFSDMEMPHVSGMELLAEIDSLDRSDPLPVVIISSRGEDEFTSRAKELGAADYLIKPLADDALDAALAAIPSLRQLVNDAPTRPQTTGEIR